MDNRRNRLAWRLCNFILNHLATPRYRGAIGGSIRLGLQTVDWERGDRILWNPGRETVDEVVVHNCTLHLEQMDDNAYWLGITKQRGAVSAYVDLTSDSPIRVWLENEDIDWERDEEHEELYEERFEDELS